MLLLRTTTYIRISFSPRVGDKKVCVIASKKPVKERRKERKNLMIMTTLMTTSKTMLLLRRDVFPRMWRSFWVRKIRNVINRRQTATAAEKNAALSTPAKDIFFYLVPKKGTEGDLSSSRRPFFYEFADFSRVFLLSSPFSFLPSSVPFIPQAVILNDLRPSVPPPVPPSVPPSSARGANRKTIMRFLFPSATLLLSLPPSLPVGESPILSSSIFDSTSVPFFPS